MGIESSLVRLESKMTKSSQELETDQYEVRSTINKNNEHHENHPFNPLNLPIGADGKPIPFWMYKLHGLNMKFPCEICGNYVYEGRRAYEKHFMEGRHEQGMRAP